MVFEEANDAIASERVSFLSKNQHYKTFLRVAVNPYVPNINYFGVQMRVVEN